MLPILFGAGLGRQGREGGRSYKQYLALPGCTWLATEDVGRHRRWVDDLVLNCPEEKDRLLSEILVEYEDLSAETAQGRSQVFEIIW